MPRNLGSEQWDEFCARVEATAEHVSWRWAAVPRGEGEWGLVALVIEVGATSRPTCRIDHFREAIIAVEELTARAAAERLRAFEVTAAGEEPVVLVPAQQNAVPQRVFSDEVWMSVPTGWPRLIVDVGGGSGAYADPSVSLLASGMTFYPSLEAAVAERIYCIAPGQVRLNQMASPSFRLIDRRGRFSEIGATADGLLLGVEEGIDGGLDGFQVQYAWRQEVDDEEWLRAEMRPSGTETLALDTNGIPAELVAFLVDRNGELVDRRAFDRRLQSAAEEPELLDGAVARWIEEGEHARLEYKGELSKKGSRSFAETVAAFANGNGGVILVGVDDEGAVIGWRPPKFRDQITDVISNLVEEEPIYHVDEVEVEGKPIVVVQVNSSSTGHRPHLVRGRTMIRVNATTRPARPAQIRGLNAGGV